MMFSTFSAIITLENMFAWLDTWAVLLANSIQYVFLVKCYLLLDNKKIKMKKNLWHCFDYSKKKCKQIVILLLYIYIDTLFCNF